MTANFLTDATAVVNEPTLGELQGVLDSTLGANWAVDGDQLTFTPTSWDFTIEVAGIPLSDIPGPAVGQSASATFTCSGDHLQVNIDNPAVRIPSSFDRVG